MGLLAPRPCCPPEATGDVTVRALEPGDWPAIRRIYSEGINTGTATFDTTVPSRASLDAKWLPDHRWVAERNGEIVGWTALSPTSTRDSYSGVAESAIYVADGHRGTGIGKALIRQQVMAADEGGLWTLQTTILTENRAAIALHHAAGYRTVGIRERIAKLNDTWHDTVLIERRTDTVNRPDC
jgi:L-amino acid N-acyltransferase YncA